MDEKTAHGWRIVDRERGVWSYVYSFTEGASANCLVVRMRDGKLLVLSPAHKLSEGAFADLAEFGEVAAVVATNGFHHLGQAAWRKRYPNARFFAPELAAKRIEKKNPGAGAFEPMSSLEPLLDETLIVRDAPRTKCGETWAIIKGSAGYLWYASDLLINLPMLPPSLVLKLLFKWTKSAPGYRLFNLAFAFLIKDKKAVLRTLLEDLERFPPALVIPAHGVPVAGPNVAAETRALVQAAL